MAKYDKLFSKIQDANEVLKGIVHRTRLDGSSTFSRITGGNVFLKLENLQKIEEKCWGIDPPSQ
jgi:threonine dehydratase